MILDAPSLPAQDHLVIYLVLCSVTFNLIHIQEEIITDQIALSSLDTLCKTFVHSILNTHSFCYKRKNDLKILEALQCVSFAREWRIHVGEVYFCSQFWGINQFILLYRLWWSTAAYLTESKHSRMTSKLLSILYFTQGLDCTPHRGGIPYSYITLEGHRRHTPRYAWVF